MAITSEAVPAGGDTYSAHAGNHLSEPRSGEAVMAAESKLEAARRRGDLAAAIGALREEARTDANAGTSPREQVDIVDGSIRLAAHLTEQGKTASNDGECSVAFKLARRLRLRRRQDVAVEGRED